MAQHEKAHERVDNVNVVNPTGDFSPGYKKSDMERIYHDAHPHSWQDLINFIEKKGDSEWHITPGEAMAMKDDLKHLTEQRSVHERSEPGLRRGPQISGPGSPQRAFGRTATTASIARFIH